MSCILKVGLETPPKRTETRGKKFLKNFNWSRDGAEKVHKQDRVRSLKNPTPLRNDASPLSCLQRNVLASLVRLVV